MRRSKFQFLSLAVVVQTHWLNLAIRGRVIELRIKSRVRSPWKAITSILLFLHHLMNLHQGSQKTSSANGLVILFLFWFKWFQPPLSELFIKSYQISSLKKGPFLSLWYKFHVQSPNPCGYVILALGMPRTIYYQRRRRHVFNTPSTVLFYYLAYCLSTSLKKKAFLSL